MAVATGTLMTRYMALSHAVTNHWGFGADQLKKHNIEPYLLSHQKYSNALTAYKELRLRARSNPSLMGELPASKDEAESTGKKFVSAVPEFKKTITNLASALVEARQQQLTDVQKNDVRALAEFLASTQQSLERNWSFPGVIEGMITKIEEETPVNIFGGKGSGR